MSFNQYRTNPGQAVSSFKGRSETPKAWPSTAVGNWTNGGLFGGGYVLEDSYKYFAKNMSFSGLMNMTNIPQTHKHLYLEVTLNNQSSWWPGTSQLPYLIVNASLTSSMPSDFSWSSSSLFGKGWSNGNFANNSTNTGSETMRPLTNYSDYGSFTTLKIYNYSVTEKLKPFEIQSFFGQGNSNSYAGWMFQHGYLMKASDTASPPVTQVSSYDYYQNGHSNYQSVAVYGFGGLV
jgi:hypothetical protein